MKTPIDATGHSGATLALINGGVDFPTVDLWTITLNGGGVIRWHGGPMNTSLTFNGNTWTSGPVITRGKISTKLGLEVATLDMKFIANSSDLINGVPIIPFAVGRGFDGATVLLYKALMPTFQSPITGCVIDFSGIVTSLKDIDRTGFTMTISAWTVLLNVNMGPDVFQAGCRNSHYDASCTLTPTNVPGTVSGSPTVSLFHSSLTNPDHYFDKGILTFTSGANNGLSRAVQSFTSSGGVFSFAFPFPTAPSAGDTFNAVRGCLLTMADCTAQSNLLHFRGEPFTPPAITGILS